MALAQDSCEGASAMAVNAKNALVKTLNEFGRGVKIHKLHKYGSLPVCFCLPVCVRVCVYMYGCVCVLSFFLMYSLSLCAGVWVSYTLANRMLVILH